jgi:hypothetical protein
MQPGNAAAEGEHQQQGGVDQRREQAAAAAVHGVVGGLRRSSRPPSAVPEHGHEKPPRQEGLIQDAAEVAALAERLSKQPLVAFDTEFIRERIFFPQLGLLQVADREQSWLLDPLALSRQELKPLLEIFSDQKILKIGHAVEQDQECLHSAYGMVASPVLDTAIAAALTGRGDQIGLAALVRKVLGVRLPKGHTRTDWLKRPLPAVMSKYALADVEHLVEVAEILLQDLDQRSEVVSLGENAAKAYAERSLDRGIEKEQNVIASRGEAVGRITREELNCAPFPNLLGADEWRCVGAAKVCVEG